MNHLIGRKPGETLRNVLEMRNANRQHDLIRIDHLVVIQSYAKAAWLERMMKKPVLLKGMASAVP